MPSSSSSNVSPFDDEGEHAQGGTRGFTPRTSISSPGNCSNDMLDATKHRRNSSVRFAPDKSISGAEYQYLSGPIVCEGNTLPTEEEDHGRSPSQFSGGSLEERIRFLESELQSPRFHRVSDPSDRGDESSELSGLITEPQWMTWKEYAGPATKATSILEVLYEKPHTSNRRMSTVSQSTYEPLTKASENFAPKACRTLERIRIRSLYINTALQIVSKQTFPSLGCLTVHRPFKIFIVYEDAIQEHLAEMESDFAQGTYSVLCKQCKDSVDLPGNRFEPRHSTLGNDTLTHDLRTPEALGPVLSLQEQPLFNRSQAPHECHDRYLPSVGGNDEECKHDISEELLAQREAIIHLRALVAFMNNEMQDVFAKHRLLRSDKAETVAYRDLWHLLEVGDIVVMDDDSNQKTPKLYRVSILPVCDLFSSRRPVKKIKVKKDGSHQQVESVFKDQSVLTRSVDLFSFDYDGDKFGPIETRISVVSYEGEKKILDLPVYPIRFRTDAAALKAQMLERGNKFCDLTSIAYRDYNGLSVAEPQEQVNISLKLVRGLIFLTRVNGDRSIVRS